MKDRNQQGFSILVLLIVLAVVCSAALAGWYVWHSNRNTKTIKSESLIKSSFPITYYNGVKCAGGGAGQCPVSGDTVNADIKVLGQVPSEQAAGSLKINGTITKIINYKRYKQSSHSMIQEGQTLRLILNSSALISSTWPSSCSSGTQNYGCNNGILYMYTLSPSQAATFIQGLQNKEVTVKLGCTSFCNGDITGLAN
ncbi:MAG TPA: hypothetical protein VLF63_00710 [Patescibacteria group bacterium]|nr:hypothetical protein [Patescibacteria group bacterium]